MTDYCYNTVILGNCLLNVMGQDIGCCQYQLDTQLIGLQVEESGWGWGGGGLTEIWTDKT